jgi:hypothetical protein
MYVFSHLHKAAGTTANLVLRRTFGLRHLDVSPAKGYMYTKSDFMADLSKHLRPHSIAGHGLRPHIDYGHLERKMEWYTIIRKPLDRCISHYQHQVEKMGKEVPFDKWIQDKRHRNWMVYFYGGGDSLQAAIDAIEKKNVRVIDIAGGLEAGMQTLFAGQLKWTKTVRNPAKSTAIRDKIRADERMMAELTAANQLDIDLFRYMKQLVAAPFPSPIPTALTSGLINAQMNFFYRNLVYRPLKKIR